MKAPTSRDVARIAGVSQTTVSRVLNEPDRVQPETRELVLHAMREAGYRPSAAARVMRTGRSHMVALVVSNLALNPLFPALLHRLFAALREKGYDASVWEAEAITEATVRALSESSVDGVIVATAVPSGAPAIAAIARVKPTVLINRVVDLPGIDQVSSDNARGGAAIADYFHAHGRRTLALVDVDLEASTLRHRVEGFRKALRRLKCRLREEHVVRVARSTYADGFAAARQLVEAGVPDAVFCVNDIVGVGVLDGLRALHVEVPKRTWVVGYDDIPMCAWAAVGLSTVRQPLEDMTREAVDRLVERIAGSKVPATTRYLVNEFIVRASSG